MDLRVKDDVEDDHALVFHQVIDAVIVGEHAPDVVGDGVELGFSCVAGHRIGSEAANPGNDFILGPLRPDERGALKMSNDPFDRSGGPVGQNHVSLHTRNVDRREQTGNKSAGNDRIRGICPATFGAMETTVALARTPLHGVHVAAGAKMVPFAGYEMPVQYAGLRKEHDAVRNGVGLFDVSHMGELWFSGPGAFDFLQHQLAGDIAKAKPGRALYTCLLNEEGGIVEDLLVYGFEDRFLLVVNASNREAVVRRFEAALPADVQLDDASDRTALLALQGPKSDAVMQAVGLDLRELAYYHHKESSLCGVPVLIGATGYTGERGFELYIPADKAAMVWAILMEAGSPSP